MSCEFSSPLWLAQTFFSFGAIEIRLALAGMFFGSPGLHCTNGKRHGANITLYQISDGLFQFKTMAPQWIGVKFVSKSDYFIPVKLIRWISQMSERIFQVQTCTI